MHAKRYILKRVMAKTEKQHPRTSIFAAKYEKPGENIPVPGSLCLAEDNRSMPNSLMVGGQLKQALRETKALSDQRDTMSGPIGTFAASLMSTPEVIIEPVA